MQDFNVRVYNSPDDYQNQKIWEFLTRLENGQAELIKLVGEMLEFIKGNSDRISALNQELYELFPEKEIIDTVYDDDEETRLKAVQMYANAADAEIVMIKVEQ